MTFRSDPPAQTRPLQPPRRQRARASVIIATLVAAVITMGGGAASAHTSLLIGSPDFDATVGGTVDFIHIAYTEPISDAVISVSYNEEPLAGTTTVPDGRIVRFQLNQPLEAPGRYKVNVEMVSYDSDPTNQTYFFSYDPAAPQPQPLADADLATALAFVDEEEGLNLGLLAIGLLAAGGLAIIGAIFLSSKRKSQKMSAPEILHG